MASTTDSQASEAMGSIVGGVNSNLQRLTQKEFLRACEREVARSSRTGSSSVLAVLDFAELAQLKEFFSKRDLSKIQAKTLDLVSTSSRSTDYFSKDESGRLLVLLSDTPVKGAVTALEKRSRVVVDHTYLAKGESLRLTPVVGFTTLTDRSASVVELLRRASVAAEHAQAFMDIVPQQYSPSMEVAASERKQNALQLALNPFRDVIQLILTLGVGMVFPFFVYVGLYKLGFSVSPGLYIFIVVSLLLTALLIWIEGFLAHRKQEPPEPRVEYGPATAIIAAYLPNEALTIEATIQAFLEVDYPDLQIILAYNTPTDMEIEARLLKLAGKNKNFKPFRVAGSTSKAQNVNAALALAKGDVIGVFDADAMPEPGNFKRAWAWISNGVDIVQGHNAVRNGASSLVSRTVAVEFEAIYAVNHPGRTRLHGFGIFGGSNGYWRGDLLRSTRMRGFMLTEDIDSSMRVVAQGGVIISDPSIIAWELAPTSLRALWNQRMRWSQGWFQVSIKHGASLLRNPKFTFQNKLGVFFMLYWREIYPWIAMQMFPLVGFVAYISGGLDKLDWLVPIYVFTTIFTLGVGPAQAINAYLLATPKIAVHRVWFLTYVLGVGFFYNEFLNAVARISQIKEVLKEKAWKVTPRN